VTGKYYYYHHQIKQDDIGGVCIMHGREEKCMQNFGRATGREQATFNTEAEIEA
jgi:hypothetical protein